MSWFVYKVGTASHTNRFGLGDSGRYRTNVWDYPGVSSLGSERDATFDLNRRKLSEPARGAAAGEDRDEVDCFCDERARDSDDGFFDELLQPAQHPIAEPACSV